MTNPAQGTTETPRIRRLIATRQFARSYDRLPPYTVAQLEKALRRLLETPGGPGVRLRPLAYPDGYHELRFAHRDRVLLRIDGDVAILLDVVSFLEVARLNARAARRLRLED